MWKDSNTGASSLSSDSLLPLEKSTKNEPRFIKMMIANKIALIAQMEKELVTEGIIRGKGFEDAIVTSSSSNGWTKMLSCSLQ